MADPRYLSLVEFLSVCFDKNELLAGTVARSLAFAHEHEAAAQCALLAEDARKLYATNPEIVGGGHDGPAAGTVSYKWPELQLMRAGRLIEVLVTVDTPTFVAYEAAPWPDGGHEDNAKLRALRRLTRWPTTKGSGSEP
jgi:hypothetical protein